MREKNREESKSEIQREIQADRQTDRWRDRQKDGPTERQTDRQTGLRLRGFWCLESSFTISFCLPNERPFFHPPQGFFELTHEVADNLQIGVQRPDCDKKRPFHHRKSVIS